MSKPREKSSFLIHVGDNDEGVWFANVDMTMGSEALQIENNQLVGHGMSLRDAIINLLDQWKVEVGKKREAAQRTR